MGDLIQQGGTQSPPLKLRGYGDPYLGHMAPPTEGLVVEGGIGHDVAFIFRQNRQDSIIIKIARPLLDKFSISYVAAQETPVFSCQADKETVKGILVIPRHRSQGQAETVGKGDHLGIFFYHGPPFFNQSSRGELSLNMDRMTIRGGGGEVYELYYYFPMVTFYHL